MDKGWKLIGMAGVDSGQLLICDPGYIDSEWKQEEFEMPEEEMIHPNGKIEPVTRCSKRWFECVDDINTGKIKLRPRNKNKSAKHNFSYNACAKETLTKNYGQLKFNMGHDGAGVVFRSGFGDGFYEVWGYFKNYGNKKNPDVRIAQVRIDLITDKELDIWNKLTSR